MFTAQYELNLRVMYINPSKPSGYYTYHHSTIPRSAHTVYLCVLCGSEIISLHSIN